MDHRPPQAPPDDWELMTVRSVEDFLNLFLQHIIWYHEVISKVGEAEVAYWGAKRGLEPARRPALNGFPKYIEDILKPGREVPVKRLEEWDEVYKRLKEIEERARGQLTDYGEAPRDEVEKAIRLGHVLNIIEHYLRPEDPFLFFLMNRFLPERLADYILEKAEEEGAIVDDGGTVGKSVSGGGLFVPWPVVRVLRDYGLDLEALVNGSKPFLSDEEKLREYTGVMLRLLLSRYSRG